MSQEKFVCLRLSCQDRPKIDFCRKYPVGCPGMEGYVAIGETRKKLFSKPFEVQGTARTIHVPH